MPFLPHELSIGQCAGCLQTFGHAEGCKYAPAAMLTTREQSVWVAAFAHSVCTRTADHAVRALRAHLASDEPSMLKDPDYTGERA